MAAGGTHEGTRRLARRSTGTDRAQLRAPTGVIRREMTREETQVRPAICPIDDGLYFGGGVGVRVPSAPPSAAWKLIR